VTAGAGEFGIAGRRVVVTGSSGFVGSRVAERFAREGAVVAGVSRTLGRLGPAVDGGACAFLECDLEDAAACVRVVGGFAPEVVVHFASRPDAAESIAHARASAGANVGATINLMEAIAPTAQVVVYGDSCKVFGSSKPPYRAETPVDPTSSYGATKAAGWWVCRGIAEAHGIAAVSVRPTLIYGPGQGMNVIEFVAQRALAGSAEIPLDGGRQTRDPLFIDDAVEACVRMVSCAPRMHGLAIPVGGGAEISVMALAERVVAACKGTSSISPRPDRARATEIWESWCDNADARRLMAWSPRVSLQDGLSRTVESIRARMHAGAGGS
jgi:nucleoside-diphosphate-sugar epimerase